MLFLVAVAVLCCIFCLALGVYLVQTHPDSRLNGLFLVLCTALAVLSGSHALWLSAPDQQTAWLWYRVGSVGWTLGPAAMFHFHDVVAQEGRTRGGFQVVFWYALGSLFFVRAITGTILAVDFTWTLHGWEPVINPYNPWLMAHGLYFLSACGLGLWRVWTWGHRASSIRRRRQMWVLVCSGIVTMLMVVMAGFVVRVVGKRDVPTLAPIVITFWAVGIWLAVTRFQLMALNPALAAEQILATMPDGLLIMGADGTVLYANPSVRKLLCVPGDTVEGRDVGSLCPGHAWLASDTLLPSLTGGSISNQEVQLGGPDGHVVPLHLSASMVQDGWGEPAGVVMVLRDITAIKQAAETLQRSEAHFRMLIENALDIVAILERDWSVRYVSPSIKGVLGYNSGKLVGLTALDIVHPEDVQRCSLAVEHLRNHPGTTEYLTARLRHRDNSWHTVECGIKLLDHESGAILINARDVTKQRLMEGHLAQADRMASVGMLAAGVAHEINNPLAYTISNLEMLERRITTLWERERRANAVLRAHGEITEDQQAGAGEGSPLDEYWLSVVEAMQGVRRVRDIVRALKAFAHPLEERATAVDINAVVESALAMAANEIRHRARLEKTLGALPLTEGNEGRLCQVFLNLLVNAGQAIEEGHVDDNCIRVRTLVVNDEIRVEVEDSGKGIPVDDVRRVFEPFFTTKAVGIGSGLGLSISHNIVAAHGGRIEVASEHGKGSQFTVCLPIRHVPTAVGATPSAEKPAPPPPARGKRRVLVVDDEPMIRSSMQRLLRSEYEVVTAESGADAITVLQNDNSFDVILCDMVMPQLTGADLFEWLNAHMPALAPHVVFMTGGAFTTRTQEFLDKVANPRIDKPVEFEILRAVLAQTADAESEGVNKEA